MTLLASGPDRELDLVPFDNVLEGRTIDRRQVETADTTQAILDEARLGYDAIVMGAPWAEDAVITPLVDEVLRHSPIPVVVVRPPRTMVARLPWAFSRALIPLNGAHSSRAAQEIGALLSSRIGTHLHQLHVSTDATSRLENILGVHAPQADRARHILDDAASLAARVGANSTSIHEHATNPGKQIMASAAELDTDLIVISGTSRVIGGELFLGQTIQTILDRAAGTVVVALAPEPRSAATEVSAAPAAVGT